MCCMVNTSSQTKELAECADEGGFQTLSLTVAYNGAPFCGFARQPQQLTVQGELERALATVFRRPVETVCAGRTDAGVHARGQVVSFDVAPDELASRTLQSLQRSLNALTHDAISVRAVDRRPQGFSARFDAKWREYRYFIYQGSAAAQSETSDASGTSASFAPSGAGSAAPIFMNDFAWHVKIPLDVAAMRQAASYLIGEHDFKSFCMAVSAEGKPTCRNVHQITIEPQEIMGESCLVIKVIGNAFLHSMVRTIVGTLVMVGRGLREPEWVAEVLAARDRTAAGENAPAKGLTFWHVEY